MRLSSGPLPSPCPTAPVPALRELLPVTPRAVLGQPMGYPLLPWVVQALLHPTTQASPAGGGEAGSAGE